MTTPAATRPAPGWLRELAAARGQYEELFGWPVSVDVEPRRLVALTGGVLDSVTMPAPLGGGVLAEVQLTVPAGPVVADPSGGWWTFLTRPAHCRDHLDELRRIGVHPARRGSGTVIPTDPAGTADGGWRWVVPPRTGRTLPPWSEVADAARRVAGTG